MNGVTRSDAPISKPHALPVEGDVLGGKYEIEHVLGEGGMCVVMAARHLQLEERVAIKLLRPELSDDAEGIERFMREGRTAIRIRNDHVVHVHDVDVLPSGTPYLVMEHLDGNDLDALILAHGPSPVALAVDYILQAGEAIAEAHSLGIVHRDLKPANLFLTRRADGSPWIKVLDFGISKMTRKKEGLRRERLTGEQAVMGSPNYMSPEQIRSTRDVDHRTDLWALGTILYELLTGVPAFDGPSLTTVCAKIMESSPTPMITLRSDAPPGLAAIVLRCLEKDANDRFVNMAELAVALADFGSPAGRISAQHIVGILSEGERPAGGILVHHSDSPWGSTSSAWEAVPKKKARHGAGLALGALLVASVAGLGAYMHSTNTLAFAPRPTVAAAVASAAPANDAVPDAGSPLAEAPRAAAPSVPVLAPLGASVARAPAVKARPRAAAPRPSDSAAINPLFDERK